MLLDTNTVGVSLMHFIRKFLLQIIFELSFSNGFARILCNSARVVMYWTQDYARPFQRETFVAS